MDRAIVCSTEHCHTDLPRTGAFVWPYLAKGGNVLTVPTAKPDGRPILRIMLYHGDAETCRHVKDVLRTHGFIHVVSVRNARAILDKVRLGRFDVLITSEQLPDLDAWRLARMLHTGRFGEHLCVANC